MYEWSVLEHGIWANHAAGRELRGSVVPRCRVRGCRNGVSVGSRARHLLRRQHSGRWGPGAGRGSRPDRIGRDSDMAIHQCRRQFPYDDERAYSFRGEGGQRRPRASDGRRDYDRGLQRMPHRIRHQRCTWTNHAPLVNEQGRFAVTLALPQRGLRRRLLTGLHRDLRVGLGERRFGHKRVTLR